MRLLLSIHLLRYQESQGGVERVLRSAPLAVVHVTTADRKLGTEWFPGGEALPLVCDRGAPGAVWVHIILRCSHHSLSVI